MSIGSDLSPPRRKRKARDVDTAQLGLFDVALPKAPSSPPPPASPPPQPPARAAEPPRPAPKTSAPKPLTRKTRSPPPIGDVRTLTIADMPDYPPELCEAVDKTLAALASEHHLMTYRAIKDCFGISRATVARRVKDGLIPGVRIAANGRVLEEGPVRRFDRTQVRWLLLAVRSRL